ncbi:TlpA family protein disulfide reductase [Streptomyces sp. NPDC053367]|uniref:TlpA family protein disulfide reductase n=1 Tax=Streptomyces sp. NPDC053367 TaxID=3365700 RepID=UPI0037D21CAE
MAVLAPVVALVGAVAVVNLILTYGLIRRLRTQGPPSRPAGPIDAASVGATAGPFSVQAVDGTALTREDLPDGALVGFFTPGCEPCTELLPRFVTAVRRLGLPRNGVLAVVAPGAGQHAYSDELGGIARVTVGDDALRVAEAFGITGYPVVCRVASDGRVTVIDRDLAGLLTEAVA